MIFQTPAITSNELEIVHKINEIRGQLKNALTAPKRWTGFLRRNMIAKAIQGSNTIEGYNVTFENAVAIMEGEEIEATEETRSALLGYRNALTYELLLSDDQFFTFNEELIRGLHYIMLSYDMTKNPGRWRPGPIFVRREPSGERVYEGPDASLVPNLMHEFVEDVQKAGDTVPVIIRAAMAHLNLVMIHPFSDGNGRMGRTIQTFILSRDGILAPQFSSIEEYLGARSNTDAYYSVLAEVGGKSWHPEHIARPWIHFCLKAHLQQAVTMERRAKEIARLWDDLEAGIKRLKLNDRMIFALYEAAMGLKVRSSRYQLLADISSQVASKDLRSLAEKGLLIPKGEKKGRTYAASPHLVAIRDNTREPKISISVLFKDQLNLEI